MPFLICKFSDFVIYLGLRVGPDSLAVSITTCSQPQKYEHCKFQIAADSKSGCSDLLLKFGKHKYFQVAKPLCFCSNPFTSGYSAQFIILSNQFGTIVES